MVPRTAIILAAGLGSRLGYKAKPLVKLQGKPLVWYPVSVLHSIGVREFCVVTRRDVEAEVRSIVSSVAGGPSVHTVVNNEPERENGYSLILAVSGCGLYDVAYVSMSDHVYSPSIPLRVSSVRVGRGYVIAGDAQPCCVDVDEATRIEAVSGVGYRVGKGLEFWTHIDTGVHIIYGASSDIVEVASGEEVVKLNTITSRLAARGELYVADVTGLPWTEIDTPLDLEETERGSRRWVVEHVKRWLSL